jgi:hypothetical protein
MTSRPPGLPIGYLVGGKLGRREGDQEKRMDYRGDTFRILKVELKPSKE